MQYYTIFYVQFLTTYQCNHYFSLFLFEFKKIYHHHFYTLFFVEDCFELTMINFS
jgi:hypothetical protein